MTTTDQAIAIHATAVVSDEFRPQGAAGKVWAALNANSGTSALVIADAAGVSRTTATKTLAAFAEEGKAIRTSGGRNEKGRALPDTWTAAPTDVSSGEAEAPEDAFDETTSPDSEVTPESALDAEDVPAPGLTAQDAKRILEDEAERRATAEAELARAEAEEEIRREGAAEALAKARATEDIRQSLTDLLAAVTTAYTALVSGDDETVVTTGLEAVYAGTADVRRAVRAAQTRTKGAPGRWGSARGDRSTPRPLRPDVLEHLAKFPGLAFTAGEIAKVLNRSAGAVANALDTLVNNGEAELISERPNRFRLVAPEPADD